MNRVPVVFLLRTAWAAKSHSCPKSVGGPSRHGFWLEELDIPHIPWSRNTAATLMMAPYRRWPGRETIEHTSSPELEFRCGTSVLSESEKTGQTVDSVAGSLLEVGKAFEDGSSEEGEKDIVLQKSVDHSYMIAVNPRGLSRPVTDRDKQIAKTTSRAETPQSTVSAKANYLDRSSRARISAALGYTLFLHRVSLSCKRVDLE